MARHLPAALLVLCLSACLTGRDENASPDSTGAEKQEHDPTDVVCEGGLEACNGACVDLSSSTEHCGACGARCFPGQECVDERCTGKGVLGPGDLRDALEEKDFLLLNVRMPPVGIIPGTDASIGNERIDELVEAIGPDRNRRVVVYCRTNPRSLRAIQSLRSMGYTNVSFLRGGVMAWARAGYDLEQ